MSDAEILLEGFSCNLKKIKALKAWVQEDEKKGDDNEDCHSCILAPLAAYYLGTLEDAGETSLAEKLKQTFDEGNVLTIADTMDRIKEQVGESIKKDLMNLDCFAQSLKIQQNQDDS